MNELEEWQHHIEHTHEAKKREVFWCGAPWQHEWAFTSIDHAVYTVLNRDRLQPCPACVKAVIAGFDELVTAEGCQQLTEI